MSTEDDIQTIRHALQSAKSNAFLHRRGGLHKLWSQLLDATRALDRIEQQVTPTQPPLSQTHIPDTTDYRRGT